jgi:hypothetical protein
LRKVRQEVLQARPGTPCSRTHRRGTPITAVAVLGASSALPLVGQGHDGLFENPVSLDVPDSVGYAITNTAGPTVSRLSFTDTSRPA